MIKLSFWEQFVLGLVLSFLTALLPQISNQTEAAALQAAITFLQRLLSGQVQQ